MSEKLSVRLKENTSRLDDILNLDINFSIPGKASGPVAGTPASTLSTASWKNPLWKSYWNFFTS